MVVNLLKQIYKMMRVVLEAYYEAATLTEHDIMQISHVRFQ